MCHVGNINHDGPISECSLQKCAGKQRNCTKYPEVVFLCSLTSLLPILRFQQFLVKVSQRASCTVTGN